MTMKVYTSKSGSRKVFQPPIYHEVGFDELLLGLKFWLDTKAKYHGLYGVDAKKVMDATKEGLETWGNQFRMYSSDSLPEPLQGKKGSASFTREQLKSKIKQLFPELTEK